MVLQLLPVFLVEVPPLGDYPNHLARILIGRDLLLTGAEHPYFNYRFTLVPNLLFDVVVLPLSMVLPLAVAGQVFVGFTMISWTLGAVLLARAVWGRVLLWPAVVAVFSFHIIFLAGFLNYTCGLGLAMIGAALWVHVRHWPWWVRLLLGSGVGSMVYLTHLLAFALYGLLIAAFEGEWLVRGASSRLREQCVSVVIAGATAVLPLLHFTILLGPIRANAGLGEGGLSWAAVGERADPAALFERLREAVVFSGTHYNLVVDIASLAALGIVFAYAFARRRVRLSPALTGAIVALGLVFLLLPKEELSGVTQVGVRFPIFLLALAVVAINIRLNVRESLVAFVLLTLCGLARAGVVAHEWAGSGSDLREMRAAYATVEPGSRVFLIKPDAPVSEISKVAPARHFYFWTLLALPQLQMLAIAERQGYASQFFTNPQKHLLTVKPGIAEWDYGDGGVPFPWSFAKDILERPDIEPWFISHPIWRPGRDWPAHYDYVSVLYPGLVPDLAEVAPDRFSPVFRGDWVDIYRIISGSVGVKPGGLQ